MKKLITLAGVLLLAYYSTNAQYTRHLVQFTDKKGTAFTLSDPTAYLSVRSVVRRTKQHINYDSTDLPVSAAYLDSIRKIPNVTIVNVSKWLNQVAIRTSDANALAKINSYAFVKKTTAVAPRIGIATNSAAGAPMSVCQEQGISSLDYGATYNQIHIHDGEYLHDLGYTGRGMVIAILDAGFLAYKTNPAFDSVRLQGRVLGEWDYVNNEASVNEDASHGAECFSIIASNRPGVIVGSAPHASFYLLRTENSASEYVIEEQNWVVAAEYADSVGVDMISSSLGYDYFDDAAFNHSYAQRDGNTALITIAADLAAKKGIFVINAAGNSGNTNTDRKFVACPADGDSILAVGGTDVNGNIAALSSWGPNGAGLLKPNVVSVAQGATYSNTTGQPGIGYGTSYACPNLAGLIACLWQAYPDFTNMEIFSEVQKSASRYTSPDNRFGYGIPNFRKAYEQLAALRELRKKDSILTNTWLKAYPVPMGGSNGFKLIFKAPASGKASIQIVNILGQVLHTRVMDVMASQTYFVDYNNVGTLSKGVYYIRYNDGFNKQTLPIIK